MTITLQNDIDRDIGRVVVVLRDGTEIGRMPMADFLQSPPVTLAQNAWLTEMKAALERVQFEKAAMTASADD